MPLMARHLDKQRTRRPRIPQSPAPKPEMRAKYYERHMQLLKSIEEFAEEKKTEKYEPDMINHDCLSMTNPQSIHQLKLFGKDTWFLDRC